jgi:cytochrome c oxidase subunit 2
MRQTLKTRNTMSFKRIMQGLSPAALVLWGLTACETGPQEGMERGEVLYEYCVACHGGDAAGDQVLGAPPIGGLPAWYISAQLVKFQKRHRGYHFDDLEGMRMTPMARALTSDTDIEAVAQYVAAMPRPVTASTFEGDADKGAALYATCAACHGADGAGMEALNAPPLVGAADWYLERQLYKFKNGMRGTAPGDVTGAQMVPMSMTLADDAAVRDVITHIQTLSN